MQDLPPFPTTLMWLVQFSDPAVNPLTRTHLAEDWHGEETDCGLPLEDAVRITLVEDEAPLGDFTEMLCWRCAPPEEGEDGSNN
mgnify:CR=1 FL=1